MILLQAVWLIETVAMYLLYMLRFMYKCGIRIIGKRYYQLMTYLTISRHNTVIDNDFLYLQTTYEQARETLVLIVYASSSGPNRQCSRIFDNEF